MRSFKEYLSETEDMRRLMTDEISKTEMARLEESLEEEAATSVRICLKVFRKELELYHNWLLSELNK